MTDVTQSDLLRYLAEAREQNDLLQKQVTELRECSAQCELAKEKLAADAYNALLKKYNAAQKSLSDITTLHSELIETHYRYRKWSTELLFIGVVGGLALFVVAGVLRLCYGGY